MTPRTTQPTKPFVVVHDDAPEIAALRGAVVAIGNFDGVHRGHRAVIGTAVTLARQLGRPAAALTFEPHPRTFLRPSEPLFRLTDERAKLRLLAGTDLAGVFVLTFNAELAAHSADAFVDTVLAQRCAIAGAVIGTNFSFGKDRIGSPDFLRAKGQQHGFTVAMVPPVEHAGQIVSSNAIRAALAAGSVAQANDLLGFPWFVTGTVMHGEKRGRELGYPTANLRLDPACGLRHGIYAVRVGLGGQRFDGVASFGRRPMFDNGAPLLEVFLFDFAGDLYGSTLDVAVIGWIRDEMRFDSIDDLVRRMDADSRQARDLLARSGDAFPPVAPI